MKSKFLGVLAVGLLVHVSAHAAHITALPGSTTYGFGSENYIGTGPKAVAAGIAWSASASGSTFGSLYGFTGEYGFGNNGNWDGLSMIGTNGETATMRIDFASPVAGVGAFMNYSVKRDGSPTFDPAVIAVYDSSNKLLESYTLAFGPFGQTVKNNGQFHGFLRGLADISYMTLAGSFIGAANLEVVRNSVPEPGTLALLGLGLAGLGLSRRRKA